MTRSLSHRESLILLGMGLLVSGLIVLLAVEKSRPAGTGSKTEVTAVPLESAVPPARDAAGADDGFNRVMIRNIGMVPFVEMFDLLRAATPEKRAQWIRQLDEMPNGPQRKAALFSFYKTFVQIDPKAAAASIDSLRDTQTKAYAVESMTAAAPMSAMGEMASLLTRMPEDLFSSVRNVIGSVIYDWSTVNPPEVAKFFDAHPDLSARYNFALLTNWAQLDPDAAKAWFDRLPESAQTARAVSGLMDGWFKSDEGNALAFMVAHGSDERFKEVISYVSAELFLRSPDEARSFLLQLPSGAATGDAMSHIAKTTSASTGTDSRAVARAPEEVARWMLTLPKETWSGAMVTVLQSWERQDETGLTQWLNQLPPGTHDDVVAGYCLSPEMEPSQRALALGLTISDATRRDETLRAVFSRWSSDSPEEAVQQLQAMALSQAQKEYLATLLPRDVRPRR